MGHQTIHLMGDKVARAQPTKSKDKHFLNNDDFKIWIEEYQQSCLAAEAAGTEVPQIPNRLGKAFLQIATALSKKPYFIAYSWNEDSIQDAVMQCCNAVRKFDTTKGTSAFAYFQQTCYYEFVGRITTEKKQKIVKAAIVQNLGSEFMDVSVQEQDQDEDYHNSMSEILQLQSIDLSQYEKKRKKKTKEVEELPTVFVEEDTE